MGVASQFYTHVCDNKVPSLVASLFPWRCLAASTSFLHAAINLRPPSVTVSTHTSAFKAVAFQSPAMPNVRMSLCTQSVHSFSFPPRPLRTAPSRFPKAIRFGSRPPLIDDVLVCLPFCWCPCMAINVSVQYDGGFLPDIILLTQCYYHRGTRLNAMKRFCIFSY